MITDKSYAKFVDDKLLCDIVKLAFIVVLDSIMKSHITEFKDWTVGDSLYDWTIIS